VTFCVLCDQQVPKQDAMPLPGRKGVAVCGVCRDRWRRAGATCARCKEPVRADANLGIFMDRYALGHAGCGAASFGLARSVPA
jgi:hypothetical protein